MIVLDRRSLLYFLSWGKIINIGCCIGDLFGDRATQVDILSLDYIRKLAKNPDLVIPNFVQADAYALPFTDQSYDTAVLSEILEHLDDPVLALNEAQRVAKTILFCVPNEYQWLDEKKPFMNPGHIINFDEKKVFDLISLSGLIPLEYYKIIYQGWSYFIVQGVSKYNKEEVVLHGIKTFS